MSNPCRLRAAAVILGAILASAVPAAAQEVGAHWIGGSSDMTQLGEPAGLGGFIRFFPSRLTSIRAGLQRATHDSQRMSRVCGQYAPTPSLNCQNERVQTSTKVGSATVLLGLRFRPIEFVELELGGGGSMNQLDVHETSESGRATSLIKKESVQWGLLLSSGVRIRPVRDVPITLQATGGTHRLNLTACADGEPRDEPYCAVVTMRELRIGVGYDFGW